MTSRILRQRSVNQTAQQARQRVTPTGCAGRAQRAAVRRRLRQGQSPHLRCASGAAWDCRTFCRTRLQSFAPGADRSARSTVLREAIEAPALSRSPRTNAPSRSPFGSASNGSSGRDRTAPQPQTRPHRAGNSPGMPPFSSSDSEPRRSQKSGAQARRPRGARGRRPTRPRQTLQRPTRRESRRTGSPRRVRVSRCRSSDRRQRRR